MTDASLESGTLSQHIFLACNIRWLSGLILVGSLFHAHFWGSALIRYHSSAKRHMSYKDIVKACPINWHAPI